MSAISLFSVPFLRLEMPNAPALNAELRDLFLRREAEGARWRNPKPSMSIPNALFESNFSLFTWPESCIQTLHEFCMVKLFGLVGEVNGYELADLRQLETQTHAWFHVTRRGGRFSAHNHPMASWSGVYCVSAGNSDASEPESGVLHFQNPHQQSGMYTDPANRNLIDAYTFKGRNLTLRAGELVLFPSWLVHEVFPFIGEGERITVAFNCSFRSRASA